MSTINKILVVGAGIAGPAVCYWLRRFGFSPTLIEKSASIRKGGQAVDIRGVAVDIVKKMGIHGQICNMRTQIELGRHVDSKGHMVHEEKGERFGFRQDEEIEILRGDLVEILMNAIEGVPCYFNQFIDHIEQNDDQVKVHFKDGRNECYDLVIGADGIHSATRSLVFNQDEYEIVYLGTYVSIFSIPNYLNLNHTEVMCDANQKLAIISSDKDPKFAQAGLLFRSPNVLNNIRNENQQQQFLRDIFQDFGWELPKILELMSNSDDFYFDLVAQVKMKSWTKGRVVLLGDAGYCASLHSGQGSSLALTGAYILAGELKKSFGDYTCAFNCYNKLLHPFVEANQKLGVWSSESFLVPAEISKEIAEDRSDKMMQELEVISSMIALPEYE